ncbi:MAG: phospholipase D family protein, partial [Muribaculaceae bacterium]|nr:phospholipase D family protein [Muribaculaceae bacterium]
ADAFLAIGLSFSRLGDVSDADFQSPLRLLEGLRQANNRVAVFCNRGGLQPPARMNPLYAMLDKSVFEVADERKGCELANFHPKIWIIKERSIDNHEKRQVKLIVMSRNLTKDTSLDCAVSMTAPLGVRTTVDLRHKHQPLKDLLLILAEKANSDKKRKIKKLANDFDSMGAFELEPPYEEYDFLPTHFGKNLNESIDFQLELPAERMVVVSPFIDEETLNWLNCFRSKQEKVLITRLDSLTKEIMEIYSSENREVWVMSQIAENNDIQAMNLHAKMYFSWGAKSGGIHLWLGSANATHNGFYRNSEFLLRLTMKRGRGQFEDFKAEFCDEKKQMCERITSLPKMELVKEDYSLAVSVRKNLISRNNLSAEVVEENGAYSLIISAKKVRDIKGRITIAPIQEPYNEVELKPEFKQCTISVANRSHLSEFYILKVKPDDELVGPVKIAIKIPTKGIPEDRDDNIFRSIIDTRDKFLNYVEMMITDRPQELATLLIQNSKSESSASMRKQTSRSNTLYESLLRIAATNPERLEDVQELVNRLDYTVVPESFAQMCTKFKQSIKKSH